MQMVEDQAKPETFMCKLTTIVLTKMTMRKFKKLTGSDSFMCDARIFNKCFSNGASKSDPEDAFYHCFQEGCGFDQCPECFEGYGRLVHQHDIEITTFADIKERAGYGGVVCDVRRFTICQLNKDPNQCLVRDDTDFIYINLKEDWGLCQGCFETYKL